MHRGSSPRVRRTPGSSCARVGARRFIPARAENALRTSACANSGFTMSNSQPRVPDSFFSAVRKAPCRVEAYKPKTVEIDRNTPIETAGVELKAGVVGGRPRDYRITFAHRALYLLPNHFAGAP